MSKWVIGKYIRLSDADRDLMKKEGKTESESVSHQKALIQNFVNEKDELKDCEQYEFFDDGFSGTNFDRPSFEKLIEQIKKGKINCVIVKDDCVIITLTQKNRGMTRFPRLNPASLTRRKSL